jgi:predicted ABC-type transport system involved in lysophospholipase L1 biosynthesis ATPase subunit
MRTAGEGRRPVLCLDATELCLPGLGEDAAFRADLTLYARDFVLVYASDPDQATELANACVGLSKPLWGSASLLGLDWEEVDAETALGLRARVGRQFRDGIWLDQLSVLENMILVQAHHTDVPFDDLYDSAGVYARAFGLPGAPTAKPQHYTAADLLKAACAAAFLGNPALVILEYPTRDRQAGVMDALMIAIRRARRRGAAILWFTREDMLWNDSTIPVTSRARLLGYELVEVNS